MSATNEDDLSVKTQRHGDNITTLTSICHMTQSCSSGNLTEDWTNRLMH